MSSTSPSMHTTIASNPIELLKFKENTFGSTKNRNCILNTGIESQIGTTIINYIIKTMRIGCTVT